MLPMNNLSHLGSRRFCVASLGLLLWLGGALYSPARADEVCSEANRENICFKMRHLRAGINAFDSQRELMQLNPPFFAALGVAMQDTAKKLRLEYGLAIIDHIEALLRLETLSKKVAEQAAYGNPDMLTTANQIRFQCMTCHSTERRGGGVDWSEIFAYDWQAIAKHCNSGQNINPYLCRSMNAMLSSYGYLLTANQAKLFNYSMTEQAALELVRILADLKQKRFEHLPEDWRAQAETEARTIAQMAKEKNPAVFEQATRITNTCERCHQQTGPSAPLVLPAFRW